MLRTRKSQRIPSAMALLLGLGLSGCGDKSEDTGTSEPTGEPASEPAGEPEYGVAEPAGEPEYGVSDTGDTAAEPSMEPEYGVSMTDNDGDGYYLEEDDCNDENPEINPGATETPGDGVDSNCDGNDDT